jgi:hypothetical protein
VRREHWDSPAQCVEYVISGTAVRFADGRRPPAEPALVALAVEDYWKLVQAGNEPVGVAAASVVYETAPSAEAVRALAGVRFAEGRATREIPEFSDMARERSGARAEQVRHRVGRPRRVRRAAALTHLTRHRT